MNRRLPAEVVSRRRPQQAAQAETTDDFVPLDRKVVFLMKPDKRQKWLTKALKQAGEGLVRASDLYDVIASTRFAEDVPYKLGQKMNRAVQQQLDLFSGKQQRYLSTESLLSTKFGKVGAPEAELEDVAHEGTDEGEAAVSQMEEMMARCRAFVREKMTERGERNAHAGAEANHDAADQLPTMETGADGFNATAGVYGSFHERAVGAPGKTEKAAKGGKREGKRSKKSRERSASSTSCKTRKKRSRSPDDGKKRRTAKSKRSGSSSTSRSTARKRRKGDAQKKRSCGSSASSSEDDGATKRRHEKRGRRNRSSSSSSLSEPSAKRSSKNKRPKK